MFFGFVKANGQLNLKELFVDAKTGHLSHTKYWSNIAYLTSTVAFIILNVFQIDKLDAGSITMLWLIYLGVVASSAMASKLISYKYDPSASTGKAKFKDKPVVDDDYEGPGRREKPRTVPDNPDA